jgi:K+-transporting ATPase ATPase C chain
MKHVRANLLLVGLSIVICCVAYPLVLWVFAQVVFPTKANGGLVTAKNPDGSERVIGSTQIAQKFTNDEYFWPRPSAADYNAAAAGGSNWGANNPKLRDRVAQQLGSMIQYKKGAASVGADPKKPRTPQQDIEAWYAAKPDRGADWAGEYSVGATNWAKTDFAKDKYGMQGEFILAWAKDHPDVMDEWKKANPTKTDEPKPEDLVAQFFASYAKVHPGKWPGVVEVEQPDKSKVKEIRPVSSDSDIASGTPALCANVFDAWLQDPDNRVKVGDLEPVPADMVTASGAGLDPHITLRNALSVYQLDRVAAKRTPAGGDGDKIRVQIEALAREQSFTALSGLVGEPLVNVLELNIALDEKFPVPAAK